MSERYPPIGSPTNSICPYCGKTIRNCLIQSAHIIPVALYKWVFIPRFVRECISQADLNVYYAHARCNMNAGSEIPTCDDITNMFLEPSCTRRLLDLRETLIPYIEEYQGIKDRTLSKQKMRCNKCHTEIGGSSVMRRINTTRKRCEENAQILCDKCNTMPHDWAQSKYCDENGAVTIPSFAQLASAKRDNRY